MNIYWYILNTIYLLKVNKYKGPTQGRSQKWPKEGVLRVKIFEVLLPDNYSLYFDAGNV